MLKAIIFDFDGLILDTESPLYQAWKDLFAQYGKDLPLSQWAAIIGTVDDDFDPLKDLETQLGYPLSNRAMLRTQVEKQTLQQLQNQSSLPGVETTLQEAKKQGLKIGLASSSNREWVGGHLKRLGLESYFDCVRTFSEVGCAKPDPLLYQSVLECLSVSPQEAIALEDSPNGITAAVEAGVFCIAIPNPLTRRLDLSHANLHLNSLEELDLVEIQKHLNGENGIYSSILYASD